MNHYQHFKSGQMTMDEAGEIMRLSGMAYRNGQYTPEEWQKKTGVNPHVYPSLIRITRGGQCVWTEQAEAIGNAYFGTVTPNWNALGLTNR
ncbi:MAG: hypothetical protein DDT21_01870 [Syntrophomonadaceae bacterium]|nr:hypothetical protein [Bacillota bacterium]